MSFDSLQRSFASGDLAIPELAAKFLADVSRWNGQLNAFISVDRDSIERNAELLSREREAGRTRSPLHGLPIAIKDLIHVEGEITSAASRLFADRVALNDAVVIRRLREAGALLAGKTNLHEFAYGGSGVISAFGPVRNPWNTAHITGGSSSGSAAVVGAGICAAAVGTDTAGSIRLPASFCGIVGFKPTYAAVSAEGVIPLAVSYDHVGPMTRNVADARTLYEVLSGTSDTHPQFGKLRVGLPESYFYRDLEPAVGAVMSSVLDELTKAGHSLERVDFPVDENRTLASFESYNYHAQWVEKTPELYQPETLRRIMRGAKITTAAAAQAAETLATTRRTAADIFRDVDILLTPTVPILPPVLEDLLVHPETLRPKELLMLRNTRPFNVLGVPAISLPWDLSASGLPVGIQLAAAPGKDFELLAIAEQLERIAHWQGRTPPEFR